MNTQNNTAAVNVSVAKTSFSIKSLFDGTKAKAKEIYSAPISTGSVTITPELESAEASLKELTKARQDAIDGINLAFNARIEAQRATITEIRKAIAPAVAQQKIMTAMSALETSLGKLQQ